MLKKSKKLKETLSLVGYNKYILERWMRQKQAGVKIETFLSQNHYYRIVLYYWNEIADLLFLDLKKTDIDIVGVIDERKELDLAVPVYNVNNIPEADLIVICTASHIEDVEESLRRVFKGAVLSMRDIIG